MFSSFLLNAVLLFAQAQEEKTTPIWGSMMPLLLMVAVFFFLIILPARRRDQQQKQAIQSALKKNARVVTHSGIIGTVAAIHANGDISLKVDDNSPVKIRMLKSSIAQVLGDEAGKAPADKPAADADTAIKAQR
jgi:preprotein translocase subunit YajC